MLPKLESACFVIADISGYTSFLAGVELDHAQDIIADVMDTVVRCLRPPFGLAKFEGDAAFFYHAEHHAWPAVPWNALPSLHQHITSHLEHQSWGYWRLQLDVLRQNNLPDGVPPIATSK
jgi:hypothetical protein